MNYLIGREDFDSAFRNLIEKYPQVISILPILVVSRENKFNILVDYKGKKLHYEHYDFYIQKSTKEDIEKYLYFTKMSGLKELLCSCKIKSIVDYLIGVEAGLDSNGHKNSGGDSMKATIEVFIKDSFNIIVPVDKSSRRYDYVVQTEAGLVIIEANFYGSSSSKLKSTAREYRNLYDVLDNKFRFI